MHFEIFPTWLKLWMEASWLEGTLNLGMWLAPFLLSIIGLHFILFKPMMAYLSDRDKETIGAREEARKLNAEVEERMETLTQRLQQARAEAGQVRASARAAAGLKAQEIIGASRAEAEALVSEAVQRIQVEKDTASQALKQTADVLSIEIAGQVLGRPMQAS